MVYKNANLRHNPGYTAWFTADTATALGVALRSLAVSLAGYAVSGSTIAAGWIGTASLVAQQIPAIFGGTFVDRHERKSLIIINAIISMASWGAICALLASGNLQYPALLIIAVFSSAVNGFLGSASDAMLKSIINVKDYPKARSLNEGRDATVNMVGSPLGGFLYGVKPWLPFLVTACMYALAGVAASCIHKTTPAEETEARSRASSFFNDFKEGWTWSLHHKTLVMVMIIAALLNFGINGIQYGIQLHLVSTGINGTYIGFINTGLFCAMLLGALIANHLSNTLPVGPVICTSLAFTCLAALPLAFIDNYWMVLIFNSLTALPFPLINAMLMGFVFAKTPDSMQGRVTVTQAVPAQALSMFCSATAGSLLPICGFNRTMLIFLISMLISAVLVLTFRPLRTIPKASEWEHIELI